MQNLSGLFGRSPFEPLVEHARKVHECVALVRPVAEAVLAGDADRIKDLQHEMSKAEYTADQIKDNARQSLPNRYFLPVNREDVARFLAAMEKMPTIRRILLSSPRFARSRCRRSFTPIS